VSLDTPSREVNQRLATMFNFVGQPLPRAHLAQAWVAYLLRQYPGARRVEVRLMLLDLPSPAQARAGLAPAWREFDRLVWPPEAARAR
jgi:hypothetical protein